MPSRTWDLIVAGLGISGAATAWQASRRGLRVLGLDPFTPPHPRGSSHGETRIIREAYFESPLYVPLVREAFLGWAHLADETGRSLFRRTGAAMVGPPEGALVRGTLAAAIRHSIPHRVLDAEELRWAFPALDPFEGMVGVVEEAAGVLAVEPCLEGALEAARSSGASLRFGESVQGWETGGSGVVVSTSRGTHHAGALVLALGPWMNSALGPTFTLPLTVERQVVHWFAARDPAHPPAPTPVTIWEYDGDRYFYGIPDTHGGVKAALHHQGDSTDPERVDRRVLPTDEALIHPLVRQFFPQVEPRPLRGSVCLYTNTPDGHFVVGTHPTEDRVVLLSACSGHGFKFAPVLGTVTTRLALGEDPGTDVAPFTPLRFR